MLYGRRQEKGVTEDEMVGCITNSMDMGLSKLQELVMDREAGVLQSMESQRVMTERLNWTEQTRYETGGWDQVNKLTWSKLSTWTRIPLNKCVNFYMGHITKLKLVTKVCSLNEHHCHHLRPLYQGTKIR